MKKTIIGCGLFVALVLSGCAGQGSTATQIPDPFLRFVNASPNSTALDFMANDLSIANDVAYLGSSPNFTSLEAGEYDVSVEESGNPETQAIETFSVANDQSAVSVAIGLVTPPNDELEKRLRISTFLVNRDRPNGDKARLVVIHAYNALLGNFTPAIDFRNPGDNPQVNLAGLEFGAQQETLLDAGSQTFVARRNGTEGEITAQKTFTFGGGKIYLGIVSGIEDSTGAAIPQITFIELLPRN